MQVRGAGGRAMPHQAEIRYYRLGVRKQQAYRKHL